MKALGLILFDCDGVLIDSEGLAHQALVEVLAEYGIQISLEEALQRYVGVSSVTEQAETEARYGIKLPPAYAERKFARRTELFQQSLQAIPGIHALVDSLPIRKCVASGSTFKRLEQTLGLCDLWDRFAPHVFSSEQVAHGKPAPDLFLFAAARMETSPSACLVIEDSVAGVRAARAAGMRVFGFTGASHCAPDHAAVLAREGAEATFSSMDQLSAALRLEGV